MPLGKLSKAQVAKGFEALEAIEDAIEHKTKGASLADLTSKLVQSLPVTFPGYVLQASCKRTS